MPEEAKHLGGRPRLRHERLDGRGRVSAVPLRLDDGVADLDRPLLGDERAADLAPTTSSPERCTRNGPN
jgi:hypothetical protein